MGRLQGSLQWEAAMAVPNGGDFLHEFVELQKSDMQSPSMRRWRNTWARKRSSRCGKFLDDVDCWRMFVTNESWRMLQATTP